MRYYLILKFIIIIKIINLAIFMQVMNLYMVLLQNRDIEKAAKNKFSERKLFFGTYFLSKLIQDTKTLRIERIMLKNPFLQ